MFLTSTLGFDGCGFGAGGNVDLIRYVSFAVFCVELLFEILVISALFFFI